MAKCLQELMLLVQTEGGGMQGAWLCTDWEGMNNSIGAHKLVHGLFTSSPAWNACGPTMVFRVLPKSATLILLCIQSWHEAL